MADAFSDDALDHNPIAQWPEIPKPKPTVPPGTPSGRMEDVMWRNGQTTGCALATMLIDSMEKTPRTLNFKDNGGKKYTIKLTGRLYLRGLFRNTKGKVEGAIADKINEKLQKKFEQNWPVHGFKADFGIN